MWPLVLRFPSLKKKKVFTHYCVVLVTREIRMALVAMARIAMKWAIVYAVVSAVF